MSLAATSSSWDGGGRHSDTVLERTHYTIYGAHCKMKMGATCLKLVKNFKKVTTNVSRQSQGPVGLPRLHTDDQPGLEK